MSILGSATTGVINGAVACATMALFTTIHPVIGLVAGGIAGTAVWPTCAAVMGKSKFPLLGCALTLLASLGAAFLTSQALGVPLTFKAALIVAGISLGGGIAVAAITATAVAVCAIAVLTQLNFLG